MRSSLCRLLTSLRFPGSRSFPKSERAAQAHGELPNAEFPLYLRATRGSELRQGEIISGLVHHEFAVDAEGREGFNKRPVEYAVVFSQDCDLFSDYKSRTDGRQGILAGVLLFEAYIATAARSRLQKNTKEWGQIQTNQVERFHYLLQCEPVTDLHGRGLEPLLIDFRRYFTAVPSDIERQIQIGTAHRRCRLNIAYRERFQNRAAFFLQRVALPDDYDS